jgi:hypothetical protein
MVTMREDGTDGVQTTDDVCEMYDGRPKLKLEVRTFPALDGVECLPAVFIEADALGFEFLGNLLLAFARSGEDCHRHLGPDVAGSVYFDRNSHLGLLLHRLPCMHPGTPI